MTKPQTDYLGWTRAEIRAGHPIENARERAAWKAYKPKAPKAFRTSYGKAGGGTIGRLARYQPKSGDPFSLAFRHMARADAAAAKPGKNQGSFAHKSGSWKKGKGGRFVGSGG